VDRRGLVYFNRGQRENSLFWTRCGGKPNLAGKTVLEIGCGHGSLAIDMAQSGAKKVVGLDLSPKLISFARQNLECSYPQFSGLVLFELTDIRNYPPETFDFVISKDALEHFIDFQQVFDEMKARLAPAGRLLLGSGGFWYSPDGGHGITPPWIPWSHLLFPETAIVARLNRKGRRVTSIRECGLNQLPFAAYKKTIINSGLKVVVFNINVTDHPAGRILSVFRKIKLLEEYCTFNLYCVLEKG